MRRNPDTSAFLAALDAVPSEAARVRVRGRRSGVPSASRPAPLSERDRQELLSVAQDMTRPGVELRVEALDGTGTSLPIAVQSSWTLPSSTPTVEQTVRGEGDAIGGLTPEATELLQLQSALSISYQARDALVNRVLDEAAETRRALVAMAQVQGDALARQSSELRAVASSVAHRDGDLIEKVLAAYQGTAEAEVAAALAAMDGEEGPDPMAAVTGLLSALRGQEPSTLLPGLLKRLAAGEGADALASAVGGLTPDERSALVGRLVELAN